MLDICFGDSEGGTIKVALGKKDVVFLYTDLAYGKIDPENFENARIQRLKDYFRGCAASEVISYFNDRKDSFERVLAAAKAGEELRIWCSDCPFSKAGLYHLIYNLQNTNCTIYVIELPAKDNNIESKDRETSWAEMSLRNIAYAALVPRVLTNYDKKSIANKWRKLVDENAMLRLNINGELCSLAEDYLDEDFLNYLPQGEQTLSNYIGILMLNCIHCIDITFITQRIEHLIAIGKILVIKRADEDKGEHYRAHTILKRT